MGKISISNSRYSYINEGEWPSGSIDIHHVIVRKSSVKAFFVAILLIPIACCFFSFKENSATLLLWSFLLSGLLFILLLLWKPVHKESVIIMPAFGVQLETHYSRYLFYVLGFSCSFIQFLRSTLLSPGLDSVSQAFLSFISIDLAILFSSLKRSGRIIRRFIPAAAILKPVLLECVTPVTCYWSLSLIIRGKEELMLVFKELRPPMKMLLPVWKALRASMDNRESPATYKEDG